jgi:hypothetical protein
LFTFALVTGNIVWLGIMVWSIVLDYSSGRVCKKVIPIEYINE